jgi:hypothetical protein
MKIRPVGSRVVALCGQTDRDTKLILAFRNSVNAPKTLLLAVKTGLPVDGVAQSCLFMAQTRHSAAGYCIRDRWSLLWLGSARMSAQTTEFASSDVKRRNLTDTLYKFTITRWHNTKYKLGFTVGVSADNVDTIFGIYLRFVTTCFDLRWSSSGSNHIVPFNNEGRQYTWYTQKNGGGSKVFNSETAPFVCVLFFRLKPPPELV